jgi:curved DNA-binding protein CbpA
MNFTNNAAIATLKVINDRMDYLSNEVEDRTYDQLVELNNLGEMRQQLEREAYIDYYVEGELKTDSVDNIKLLGERPINPIKKSVFANRIRSKVTLHEIARQLVETGLVSEDVASNYATRVIESIYPQYIKAA